MNVQLIKKASLATAKWAGGTTTQLAIFPEGAEYAKFNFTFRLSTATVEVERSTFTFMPGVTRHLMILEGSLHIDHTGRYKKQLRKFNIDTFNGEWPTTAEGKVTDFNLMTRNNAEGYLEAQTLSAKAVNELPLEEKEDYTGIYINDGAVELRAGEQSCHAEKGDCIFITHGKAPGERITIVAAQTSELVIARILLK